MNFLAHWMVCMISNPDKTDIPIILKVKAHLWAGIFIIYILWIMELSHERNVQILPNNRCNYTL